MKPILKNPYGYKICYTQKPIKNKYVTKFHIHSFRRAMRIKREYVARRKKKHNKITWHVIPITKTEVKRGIWKTPF